MNDIFKKMYMDARTLFSKSTKSSRLSQTMKKTSVLDQIYQDVHDIILSRQHPVTGLFPASTSVNSHGDYTDAWVRDNVYTIMSVWALCLAYKKEGHTDRWDELSQATIKLMRGLLQSMMRQADKVESFKVSLHPLDAIHAKYSTSTGLPVVADDGWGHLQIDATSLFLLMLAQMTASGLRIIFTKGEVDFVQNLIYYISRAHRIPDYGIWERGNKINNGKTEVNASSVGMAKAALQAMDGLNLFGPNASKKAVVYVVADSVARASSTLGALLPKESRSKEVDGALLSIIGFPSFAVDDEHLVSLTRREILTKLSGHYGCKRFLLDGHQTVLEDSQRIYYEHSELSNFEDIESEWPLFFTYLYIDSFFSGNEADTQEYREKLESLLVDVNGKRLLPELYYVEKENIDAEKENPGSQPRTPNKNIPLIWAQSLFIVGSLLDKGFINTFDIDPLNLSKKRRQQKNNSLALVILSQNARVKELLASHGVLSETIDEIKPISVISASHLMDTFRQVGANELLTLTGRPKRAVPSLATSQPYCINGEKLLCLSWMQEEQKDYRKGDAKLIAETLKLEIRYIKKHWYQNGPAVYTLLVDESLCQIPDFEYLLKTLKGIQLRSEVYDGDEIYGVYATADLAYRGAQVKEVDVARICLKPFTSYVLGHKSILGDEQMLAIPGGEGDLIRIMFSDPDENKKIQALDSLVSAVKLQDKLLVSDEGKTVKFSVLLFDLYRRAQRKQQWKWVRYCFAHLTHDSQDLGEALAEILVRRLTLVVGLTKENSVHITHPMPFAELLNLLESVIQDPLERALTMELLLTLGGLTRTEPALFEGLRRIKVHDLFMMCAEEFSLNTTESVSQDGNDAVTDNGIEHQMIEELSALSPYQLYEKVRSKLLEKHQRFSQGVSLGFYSSGDPLSDPLRERTAQQGASSRRHDLAGLGTDWFSWRNERGLVTRIDGDFLQAIWSSLKHVDTIIFSESHHGEMVLDCQIALKSMTPGEENFALLIEKLILALHPAYYKSMVMEALYGFTEYCACHDNVRFSQPLHLVKLLEDAAELYAARLGGHTVGAPPSSERNSPTQTRERPLDLMMVASPEQVQRFLYQALDTYANPKENKTLNKENESKDILTPNIDEHQSVDD